MFTPGAFSFATTTGRLDSENSPFSQKAGDHEVNVKFAVVLKREWQQNPLQVRRQWMELLHMDPEEIEELCRPSQLADLQEELAQLDAANAILERNRNRRCASL